MLRRHPAAGWGTATWLRVLFSFLGAAGPGRGARRCAGKSGCDPWLARPLCGPAPAARGPAAAGTRAPPSASRRPRCLLPCSLAPSPRAGSALTPPHAAAAAGRWRGTTAARCWTKSSPPSSSTISPTRRYGQPEPQAEAEVPSCRGCSCSGEGRHAAVGALGRSGVPGCRAPLLPPCDAHRYRGREVEVPRRVLKHWGRTAAGEGLAWGTWSLAPHRGQIWGHRASLGRWSRAKV